MTILMRTKTGWAMKLNDADARTLGVEWCPLPLTSVATIEDAMKCVGALHWTECRCSDWYGNRDCPAHGGI